MADFGVSFMPGANGAGGQGDPQGQQPAGSPLQQAIKFLSLRLPRFTGPGALAPEALLNAPGAGGLPGGPESLTALLQQLAGMQQPPGMSPMAPSGGSSGGGGPLNYPGGSPQQMPRIQQAPTPRVTPGGGPAPNVMLPQPAPAPAPTWTAPRMPRQVFQDPFRQTY